MLRTLLAAALVVVTLAGCTTTTERQPVPTPTPAVDSTQIRQTAQQTIPLGGASYTVTSYVNDAYTCGLGTAPYPFVTVEQSGEGEKPLWVMLHGGGTGWYGDDGKYVGDESNNAAESAMSLLSMVGLYLLGDTAIGERVRDGDRVALGSLCDHDLMMGLGQPYPNNPAGGTVDGLLANLAMVDYVAAHRATSDTFIVGQSAGSYGAWALAHSLWSQSQPVAGVILDSGLLSERSFDLFEAGIGAEYYAFDADQMAAKHGPYFTDASLYAENALADGFDVPLFVADAQSDPGCGGNSPAIGPAAADGYAFNCDWLYQPTMDAVTSPLQQVHIYPGGGHIVTASPGQVQTDLRAWLALLG